MLKDAGISQSELARRLEPPEAPTWVNNRMTGYSTIKADDIPRLARALNVPCHRFFEDADCPEHDTVSKRTTGPLLRSAEPGTPYEAAVGELIDQLTDVPEERDIIQALLRLKRRYSQPADSSAGQQ